MGCGRLRSFEALRPDIDAEEGLRVIEDMEIEDIGGSEGAAGGEGRCWRVCRWSGGRL